MRTCTLIVALLLAFTTASAQIYLDTPSLVIPVRDATGGGTHRLHVLWNKLVFTSSMLAGSPKGDELWTYDGLNTVTPAPEIYPGSISGIKTPFNGRGFSAIINDVLYFSGVGPNHGNEVFKWDGINAPTAVTDIRPGVTDSEPVELTALNNKLYFFATSVTIVANLYEYDPTNGSIFKTPAPVQGISAVISGDIIAHNGKIYYRQANNYSEFYEYDPITKQFKSLSVLLPNGTAFAGKMLSYGSKFYYTVETPRNSTTKEYAQLYSYDGTNKTPLAVGKYLRYRSLDFYLQQYLLPHNGKIYFWGNANLMDTSCLMYSYDTLTGQILQAPNVKSAYNSDLFFFGVFKNNIYYRDGDMLVRYDGTKADTMLPYDFRALSMIEYNNEIYMVGKSKDQNPDWSLYRLRDTLVPGTPPSSIQEISFQADIKLYPNPATDIAKLEINLQTAGTISIHLTDISSREIQTIKPTLYSVGKNNITLQLDDTPPGNYIVTLHNSSGETLWSGKLVHQ